MARAISATRNTSAINFDNNYYATKINTNDTVTVLNTWGNHPAQYLAEGYTFYEPTQLVPLGQGESYNGTILKIGGNSYGVPSDAPRNIDVLKAGVNDVQTLVTPTEKLGDYTFIYRNGTYIIDSTSDFLNFAAYAKNNNCEGLKFWQRANIDLSDKDFTTITGFAGTYDGGGKLIISSNEIFSGSTGTISDGYCCGTDSNGFTRVYKLNVPENVTVSGAKSFNNKYYAQSDATITISDFTGGEIIFDDAVTSFEQNGENILAKVDGTTVFTVSGITANGESAEHWSGFTYVKDTTGGANLNLDNDNHKIILTATTSSEDLFKVEGFEDGTEIEKPTAKVGGGYTITLPDESTNGVIITELKSGVLANSTIYAGSISNLTAQFVATVETSGSATVNGVTYTSAGGGLTISTTEESSNLVTGTITITDEQAGVKVTGGDGVNVTFENGAVKNISGLNDGESVTYGGKTYSHTITLPEGVTATADNTLTIDDKIYYADGSTVTIKNFGEGSADITFDSAITSLEVSGNNIWAKIGNDTAFTVSDLSLYSTTEKSWSVNGSSASYGTEIHKGAKIDGKKIIYQSDDFNATFTLENLAADITKEKLKAAVSVQDTEITFTADTVLDSSKVVTAPTGYTLKLDDNIYPKSTAYSATTTVDATTCTYISDGETEDYGVNYWGNELKYYSRSVKEFTITGLSANAKADDISVNGTTIKISKSALAQGNATLTTSDGFTMELDGVSAATLTEENWNGLNYQTEYYSAEGWEVDGKNINYTGTTTPKTLFKLSGVESTGGFTVSKNENAYTVKVADSAVTGLTKETIVTLTDIDSTISANFAFDEDFSGKTTKTENAATLSGGKYTSKTYNAYSEINGANLTFHPATTAKEFTITNLSNAALLGTNVIVTDGETTNFKFYASALDKKSVTISGGTFSVELDTGVDTTADTISESKILNNGTLSYTAAGVGEYYAATNSGVTYNAQSHGETFTLTGIKSANGVSVSGGTVTLTESALDLNSTSEYQIALSQDNSNISNAVTFNLNFSGVNTTAKTVQPALTKSGTDYIYESSHTAAYFNGSGNQYTFKPATSFDTVKISGLKTTGNLTVSEDANSTTADVIVANGKVIVKSTAINNSHEKISIDTTNYNLELGDGISQAETTNFKQSANGGTYTITLSGTSAGYKKNGNEYTWQDKIDGETFTITGLKSGLTLTENNFTRSNGKITLKLTDSMLTENPTEISISSTDATNYALDYSALSTNSEVKAHWEGFNYISDKTATSWTASNNNQKITYTKATGGEILTTISGVKSTDGLSVSGNVVTVSNSSLNKNNVSVSNGYTLKLADDVTKISTNPAHWEIDSSTANYIGNSLNAGYSIINNQIMYQDKTTGENLIKISGLNSNATLKDISLSGKIVTISANALDSNKTVEISEGYILSLAKDVPISKITGEIWQVSNGIAYYKQSGRTAGYFLSTNKIVYREEIKNAISVTVSGLKNTATAKDILLDGKNISIAASAVGNGAVTIPEGFSLILGTGNCKNVLVVGGKSSDNITQKGNGAVIATGAGDDIISLGSSASNNTIIGGAGDDSILAKNGKNYYSYSYGDGNDVISGWTKYSTLQIVGGNIENWNVNGKDLTLNVGKGSIKILDGVGVSITSANSNNKNVTNIYYEGKSYDAKKTSVTLTSSIKNIYTETNSSVVSINGAAANSIEIIGNSKNNSILGGSGNDTLNGGRGNDTLIGGNGSDVFIYSAGKDIITDYAENDKIVINANFVSSVTGKDVVFKVGSNTLTAKNAVGKKVTINDSVIICENGKIYSGDKTNVTFNSAFKGIVEKSIKNIYGADSASSIVGNSSNNVIIGGKCADTLNGSAGNDTLTGGDGKDLFIYESGNDIILDYSESDKISCKSEITNSYAKGNDFIFETKTGSLKVLNGAGKKITTLDSKNKSSVQTYYNGYTVNQKQTAVTITSYFFRKYLQCH